MPGTSYDKNGDTVTVQSIDLVTCAPLLGVLFRQIQSTTSIGFTMGLAWRRLRQVLELRPAHNFDISEIFTMIMLAAYASALRLIEVSMCVAENGMLYDPTLCLSSAASFGTALVNCLVSVEQLCLAFFDQKSTKWPHTDG